MHSPSANTTPTLYCKLSPLPASFIWEHNKTDTFKSAMESAPFQIMLKRF
jgi:hypothetical protein